MNFFIAGLPRSRTAWLANLLTWGPSFCWHDAFAGAISVSGIVDKVEQAKASMPDVKYFGNSDSVQPRFAHGLYQAFPDAKWVFVARNFEDCYRSFCRALPVRDVAMKENFQRVHEALEVAVDVIPIENQMTVAYSRLNVEAVVQSVWDFVLPAVPWVAERWTLLDALRVTVIPEKAYKL